MLAIKAAIYQAQQIKDIENRAQLDFGLSSETLMQRAGHAAFDYLIRRFPQAERIIVCCGSGNNGGDGYVLAELAHERGLKVSVWQIGKTHQPKEAALHAFENAKAAKIPIYAFHDAPDLKQTDLIVDAICGTGLTETLRDNLIDVLKKIEQAHIPIFSLDVPTGIHADTGEALGMALQATATMTFIGLKMGLLTGKGIACTGELVVNDLQLPPELLSSIPPVAEKISLQHYQKALKPRSRDWHKGLSGHVLVIGGESGFSGAVRLAAEAALRVGAGLVSIATRPEHAALLNLTRPEIMCHGIADFKALAPLLAKATVIVIGPGLGLSSWGKALWESLSSSSLPLVVDADALTLLSESPNMNKNWVLTPHPGEAARLLHESTQFIQNDRLKAAKTIQQRYGGICVLKGAGTLVIGDKGLPGVCDKGNPGMASAGLGDVLSGVIGGLIAQGLSLDQSAALGVALHAAAGDLAAKEGERGLIASDLMPYLHRLSNHHDK